MNTNTCNCGHALSRHEGTPAYPGCLVSSCGCNQYWPKDSNTVPRKPKKIDKACSCPNVERTFDDNCPIHGDKPKIEPLNGTGELLTDGNGYVIGQKPTRKEIIEKINEIINVINGGEL